MSPSRWSEWINCPSSHSASTSHAGRSTMCGRNEMKVKKRQRSFAQGIRTKNAPSTAEIAPEAPIVAMIVLMGVYPRPFLKTMEPAVSATIERLEVSRRRLEPPVRVALDKKGGAAW